MNEHSISSGDVNSLLATMSNDSYSGFSNMDFTAKSTANNQMPVNLKRLSFPQASALSLSNSSGNNGLLSPSGHSQQQQQHHQHHQSASSSFMNSNRLNSNHNLFGSVNPNLLSSNSNEAQNLSSNR